MMQLLAGVVMMFVFVIGIKAFASLIQAVVEKIKKD